MAPTVPTDLSGRIAPVDPSAATAAIETRLPLRTERMTLRRFAPGDLDAFRAYQTDDATVHFLWRPMLSEAQLRERVHADPAFTPAGGSYAIAIDVDGALVGETVVKLTDPAGRQAEIGWIVAPEHRGRGYALEAGRATLDLAWTIGAHRVVAILDSANTASARVAERLGMRREARHRDDGVHPLTGAYGSSETWAILETERQQQR